MLTTKSVDSPIDREADGLRILATRFRGRGMPSNRYDVWMPSLGPSEGHFSAVLACEFRPGDFSGLHRMDPSTRAAAQSKIMARNLHCGSSNNCHVTHR